MKAERLDRIYIFVRDLEKARNFFADLLDTEFSEPVEFKEIDMRASISPLRIALAESLTPDGWVAKTIERRGEGIAIVALKVPNLEEATAEMQSRGIRLVQRFTLGAVEGSIHHPKDAYGVMLDLNEYKERHPIIDALLEQ